MHTSFFPLGDTEELQLVQPLFGGMQPEGLMQVGGLPGKGHGKERQLGMQDDHEMRSVQPGGVGQGGETGECSFLQRHQEWPGGELSQGLP